MPLTFGDLVDATNTARRDLPLVVEDQDGIEHVVTGVEVRLRDVFDDAGEPAGHATTAVRLTVAPADS